MSIESTTPRKPARKATHSGKVRNVVAMLQADHRHAEELFAKFAHARTEAMKVKYATQVCEALTLHMVLEEEVFYPACRDAGLDVETMDEARIEHDGATRLVAEIQAGHPGEAMWEAKVMVLAEQIRHHVKEEEKPGGIFSQAKKAGLDLEELGEALADWKRELAR